MPARFTAPSVCASVTTRISGLASVSVEAKASARDCLSSSCALGVVGVRNAIACELKPSWPSVDDTWMSGGACRGAAQAASSENDSNIRTAGTPAGLASWYNGNSPSTDFLIIGL
jgi:hypothetical protein